VYTGTSFYQNVKRQYIQSVKLCKKKLPSLCYRRGIGGGDALVGMDTSLSSYFCSLPHIFTALLVKMSPDRSPVVSLGIFSEASDKSMCPGSTQPLRNEYQDSPGSKGGLCLGLTTLPP
jgi:hypothetical protein